MLRLSHSTRHDRFPQLAAVGLFFVCLGNIANAAHFSDGYRWTSTYTNGPGLDQGDATTLRWSIVPDGTEASGGASNLVGFLDELYGVENGTAVLTDRPWFNVFAAKLDEIEGKTALRFEYAPDDGAGWSSQGATSGHGDIRIAGYDLPAAGELGNAKLPALGGDLLLDTANTSFANPATLGAVFQHEIGHALGLLHVSVPGSTVLMSTDALPTNGPQFDDLYALTRLYGDRLESNGGNDSPALATDRGLLSTGQAFEFGIVADDQATSMAGADLMTIDGQHDVDVYRFELAAASQLNVTLSPSGPTYAYIPEGQHAQTLVASGQANLKFRLLASDGATPLATIDRATIGAAEHLSQFDLPEPGAYFLEVSSDTDANQSYHLTTIADAGEHTQTPRVFRDRFDATGSELNVGREHIQRQLEGYVDSPFEYTIGSSLAGDPAVQMDDGQLVLTATQGGVATDTAIVRPIRNFGPQLSGQRWLLSLDLRIDSETQTDLAAFALVIDDAWSTGSPHSDAAELTMEIAADGAYHATELGGNAAGEANRSGNRLAANYHMQILVDETSTATRVTVGVNGDRLLTNEVVAFDSLERYFSLHALTHDGLVAGQSIRAEIDELSIALLTDVVAGDYNLDGHVDLADYTVWRDTLGSKVLAGTAADGNRNGVVDVGDYSVWKQHIGGSTLNVVTQNAVPEPCTCLLVVVMAVALTYRERYLAL